MRLSRIEEWLGKEEREGVLTSNSLAGKEGREVWHLAEEAAETRDSFS